MNHSVDTDDGMDMDTSVGWVEVHDVPGGGCHWLCRLLDRQTGKYRWKCRTEELECLLRRGLRSQITPGE